MRANCDCGESLEIVMPQGRWSMDPVVFQRQNPLSVPIYYAILLSQEGSTLVRCRSCSLAYTIGWGIVLDPNRDRQGTKAHYVMEIEGPITICSCCQAQWKQSPTDGEYRPETIKVQDPCSNCIKAAGADRFRVY